MQTTKVLAICLAASLLISFPALAEEEEWTKEQYDAYLALLHKAPNATEDVSGDWYPLEPDKLWVAGKIVHLWGYGGPWDHED